jgi:hypothetical protein
VNTFTATINPKFLKDKDPSQNELKLRMEAKLSLKTSHSWIRVAENLHLNNGGTLCN